MPNQDDETAMEIRRQVADGVKRLAVWGVTIVLGAVATASVYVTKTNFEMIRQIAELKRDVESIHEWRKSFKGYPTEASELEARVRASVNETMITQLGQRIADLSSETKVLASRISDLTERINRSETIARSP